MFIFKKIIDLIKRFRNKGHYALSSDPNILIKSITSPNPELGSYWKVDTVLTTCYEVVGYTRFNNMVKVIDIVSGKEMNIPVDVFENLFYEVSKFRPKVYTRDTF